MDEKSILQQYHYIEFLSIASKLKTELRHSWPLGKENNRRESVADHQWRLVLMKIDVLKSVLMACIHDLPEALTGDIPVLHQDSEIKKQKDILEHEAFIKITDSLDDELKLKLRNAYNEYEEQNTYEAKFVKALDKIEAFQQHNLDPLDTWEEKEKEMLFQYRYCMKHCEFDRFLKSLAQTVIDQGIQKLKNAGENVELIQNNAIEKDKYLTL